MTKDISKKIKVVMTVSNDFTTDYRVYREATALIGAGYDVTIFCVHLKGLAREEEIDGIQVRRILDNYLRLPFTIGARKVRKVWLKALRDAKGDIYHAHDRDTVDYSVKVAGERGVPVIYDSHEYWPDKNQYENNTGSLRDRVSGLWWNAKEKRGAIKANAMIMTSPGHAKKISEDFKIPMPTLVRNIPIFQRGQDKDYLKRKFKLNDQAKIVVYVGNIQKNRGIEEMMMALRHLPKNIHFVVLGYGQYRETLMKNTPTELKSRVHFHEPTHFLKIVPIMYSADMGVAPFQASCFSHYHVLPNKPFDYLMAELPIATSNFPDMKKIVEENKVGTTFEPKDPKSIAKAVMEVLGDDARYSAYQKNASKASQFKFRWDKEKENLISLYSRLLGH